MTDRTLLKLRELLLNEFSEPELIALCKDIGLDYAALPGTGTFGKTREIVEAARAQDKLRLLQSRLRELKPEAYADSMGAAPMSADSPTPIKAERNPSSPLRAFLPLLALLILVIAASLIFTRLSSGPPPQAELRGIGGEASPATALPALTPAERSAQPEAMTAHVMTDQIAIPEIASPVAAETVIEDPTATVPVVPTPPALPSPPSPVAADTPTLGETHPAAANILQINDQLVLFYTGQASVQDLEYFWMGDALRTVVDFGHTRLPRAMRIRPDQRDALEISHEYLRPPTVVSETTNGAVIASREFWRYANSLNRNRVCEVRDYVYNMVRDGERYRVRSVQSRLVRSGCAD